jgi:hypothetical protein
MIQIHEDAFTCCYVPHGKRSVHTVISHSEYKLTFTPDDRYCLFSSHGCGLSKISLNTDKVAIKILSPVLCRFVISR